MLPSICVLSIGKTLGARRRRTGAASADEDGSSSGVLDDRRKLWLSGGGRAISGNGSVEGRVVSYSPMSI